MTDAGRDAVASRDAQAVELRSTGKSYAAIARALGLDNSRDAVAAFNRGIRAKPVAELARLRVAEGERLDLLARRMKAREELGPADMAQRLKRVESLRAQLLAD